MATSSRRCAGVSDQQRDEKFKTSVVPRGRLSRSRRSLVPPWFWYDRHWRSQSRSELWSKMVTVGSYFSTCWFTRCAAAEWGSYRESWNPSSCELKLVLVASAGESHQNGGVSTVGEREEWGRVRDAARYDTMDPWSWEEMCWIDFDSWNSRWRKSMFCGPFWKIMDIYVEPNVDQQLENQEVHYEFLNLKTNYDSSSGGTDLLTAVW